MWNFSSKWWIVNCDSWIVWVRVCINSLLLFFRCCSMYSVYCFNFIHDIVSYMFILLPFYSQSIFFMGMALMVFVSFLSLFFFFRFFTDQKPMWEPKSIMIAFWLVVFSNLHYMRYCLLASVLWVGEEKRDEERKREKEKCRDVKPLLLLYLLLFAYLYRFNAFFEKWLQNFLMMSFIQFAIRVVFFLFFFFFPLKQQNRGKFRQLYILCIHA